MTGSALFYKDAAPLWGLRKRICKIKSGGSKAAWRGNRCLYSRTETFLSDSGTLLRRDRMEDDLTEEVRFHLQSEIEMTYGGRYEFLVKPATPLCEALVAGTRPKNGAET